jgi:hypothetical protein
MTKAPKHTDPKPERHEHHIHQEKSQMEWAFEAGVFLLILGTLIATSVAAYWTGQQWVTTDDQEKRQLRAHVGVIAGSVGNLGDRENQTFNLTRKNYGVTPAYDLTVIAFGESIIPENGAVPVPDTPLPPDIKGTVTLFPTAELPLHINGIFVPITQNVITHLMDSDDLIFVYIGTLQYHDAFGKKWFTYFCWMFNRKGVTAKDADACYGHNDST